MKKKLAIIGTVTLLGVGAAVLSNQEWRANTIFATAKDKQLAWLKEHEKEIVKWMHSVYPKVESVQFDWNTLRVGPVSNGVAIAEYNLSVTGTFNNNPDTVIHIDFGLDKSDSIPNMSGIRMNQPPRISRGKVLEIYE
jgi:lipoprotein